MKVRVSNTVEIATDVDEAATVVILWIIVVVVKKVATIVGVGELQSVRKERQIGDSIHTMRRSWKGYLDSMLRTPNSPDQSHCFLGRPEMLNHRSQPVVSRADKPVDVVASE